MACAVLVVSATTEAHTWISSGSEEDGEGGASAAVMVEAERVPRVVEWSMLVVVVVPGSTVLACTGLVVGGAVWLRLRMPPVTKGELGSGKDGCS